VGVLESAVSLAHGLVEVRPQLPGPRLGDPENIELQAVGVVFAQKSGRGSVHVPPRGLGEDTDLRERPEQPAQYLRVHLERPGQVRGRRGFVAEFFGDSDAYRGAKGRGPGRAERELTYADDGIMIGDIFFLDCHRPLHSKRVVNDVPANRVPVSGHALKNRWRTF
jgi:hypothetical protein